MLGNSRFAPGRSSNAGRYATRVEVFAGGGTKQQAASSDVDAPGVRVPSTAESYYWLRPATHSPKATNSIAVAASINGYCIEIELPHARQRPRRMTQDAIGIKSYHARVLAHDMHSDLQLRERLPRRSIMTLRKLPTQRPSVPKTSTRKSMGVIEPRSAVQRTALFKYITSPRREGPLRAKRRREWMLALNRALQASWLNRMCRHRLLEIDCFPLTRADASLIMSMVRP
jgi:hypothetical protein